MATFVSEKDGLLVVSQNIQSSLGTHNLDWYYDLKNDLYSSKVGEKPSRPMTAGQKNFVSSVLVPKLSPKQQQRVLR